MAIQRVSLDTALFSPNDRYDWWAAEVEGLIGITAGVVEDTFWGRLDAQTLGPLTHLAFEAKNNIAQRLAPQIRRLEWGQYFIYREMGVGGVFEVAGREFVTGQGDLLIYDGDAMFKARSKADYRHHIWTLPRGVIDPHLPYVPRPLGLHIKAGHSAASLASAYMDALGNTLGGVTEQQAAQIADNLGRLIAIVCGGAARAHGEAVRRAKLEQSRQYVERRLTAPELNPEQAAADLGISLRQLHGLFEMGGESFGQYVRRRRLEECRLLLESPSSARLSITDIAFGAGFASLPTFYRAFSAAFDAAPGDLRPRLLQP